MERLDGGVPAPAHLRGAVVALGNFDGFHLGHQAVVGRAVERARDEGRPAIVATFDPHPVRFFRPDAPPFRLTTLDQRERLFGRAGADAMLVFGFDERLAAMGAREFVDVALKEWLGAAAVVTGEDFTFARGREGSAASLPSLGMPAEAVAPVLLDGRPVSSSRVREFLRSGEPEAAARLLTRPFAVEGAVQHGDKRGRELGYPTANMELGKYLRPRYGVYAVRGRLPDGRVVSGAANLGVRPQFEEKELLESFFFEFNGDLYGRCLEVELVSFLRPEARFDGLDALRSQMEADCAEARRRLAAE